MPLFGRKNTPVAEAGISRQDIWTVLRMCQDKQVLAAVCGHMVMADLYPMVKDHYEAERTTEDLVAFAGRNGAILFDHYSKLVSEGTSYGAPMVHLVNSSLTWLDSPAAIPHAAVLAERGINHG